MSLSDIPYAEDFKVLSCLSKSSPFGGTWVAQFEQRGTLDLGHRDY